MRRVQKLARVPAAASNTSMACPRCGSDCSCACSGDPIPSQDWRRQVSLQVRAHKVRKHHRLDPNAPQLEFDDHTPLQLGETSASAMRSSSKRFFASSDESNGIIRYNSCNGAAHIAYHQDVPGANRNGNRLADFVRGAVRGYRATAS